MLSTAPLTAFLTQTVTEAFLAAKCGRTLPLGHQGVAHQRLEERRVADGAEHEQAHDERGAEGREDFAP